MKPAAVERSKPSKSAAAVSMRRPKFGKANWEAAKEKEKVTEDEARWTKKYYAGCDHILGCITCKDLAKKNGSIMLEEKRTCPVGLGYGRIPGTGPTTCQFDCNICLGRDTKEPN